MAYSAVPTVTTGDLWTAANHNTYIRDNFAAGVPAIFTAKGDLAVATGANAATRLAVGSNYQVLVADSAQAAGARWAGAAGGIHVGRAYASDYRSCLTGTPTIINFDFKTSDTLNLITTGAAWKFTAPATGYYAVAAFTRLTGSGGWADGEYSELCLYKNGAEYSLLDRFDYAGGLNYSMTLRGTDVIYLAANEYIDVRILQNSGATIDVIGGIRNNHVAIWRV